jgi:hypothetical protein
MLFMYIVIYFVCYVFTVTVIMYELCIYVVL